MQTDDLAAWLATRGIADAKRFDGDIPPMPDRFVGLTLTGGPGEKRERTFDVLSVQVVTRGGQRDADDAEAMAQAVDDAFMGAIPPLMVGSRRIIAIARTGGPPALMARDEAERALFVCSYLFEAARSTH